MISISSTGRMAMLGMLMALFLSVVATQALGVGGPEVGLGVVLFGLVLCCFGISLETANRPGRNETRVACRAVAAYCGCSVLAAFMLAAMAVMAWMPVWGQMVAIALYFLLLGRGAWLPLLLAGKASEVASLQDNYWRKTAIFVGLAVFNTAFVLWSVLLARWIMALNTDTYVGLGWYLGVSIALWAIPFGIVIMLIHGRLKRIYPDIDESTLPQESMQ